MKYTYDEVMVEISSGHSCFVLLVSVYFILARYDSTELNCFYSSSHSILDDHFFLSFPSDSIFRNNRRFLTGERGYKKIMSLSIEFYIRICIFPMLYLFLDYLYLFFSSFFHFTDESFRSFINIVFKN